MVTKDPTLGAVAGTQTGAVTPLGRKDTIISVENIFISENTEASERRSRVFRRPFLVKKKTRWYS